MGGRPQTDFQCTLTYWFLPTVCIFAYRYLLIKMISIDINAKGIYLIVKFVRRQLRQLRRKQQNIRDFCANSCPKIQIYCQTRICAKIIFVLTKKQTQSFSRHWPTSLEKIEQKNCTYFILPWLLHSTLVRFSVRFKRIAWVACCDLMI